MKPKKGKAGKPITPMAPEEADEADVADPGEVTKMKSEAAEKKDGKYSSEKAKPHKPAKADEDSGGDDDNHSNEENEKKTAWIEIEMVGEDDKPIAGEKYKVTLPDGTVDQGTLDQNGYARIEGFEEGDCKITFPNLDKKAWEFIESAAEK